MLIDKAPGRRGDSSRSIHGGGHAATYKFITGVVVLHIDVVSMPISAV